MSSREFLQERMFDNIEMNSVRGKRKDQITTYPIQKEPNCSLKTTMNSPNTMLMSVETNCPPICHFQFSTKENLKIHLKNVHPMSKNSEEKQVEIEDLNEKIIREVFKCEQCSYSSVRKWYLKHHIKSEHETIEEFKCELCPYTTHQLSRDL